MSELEQLRAERDYLLGKLATEIADRKHDGRDPDVAEWRKSARWAWVRERHLATQPDDHDQFGLGLPVGMYRRMGRDGEFSE